MSHYKMSHQHIPTIMRIHLYYIMLKAAGFCSVCIEIYIKHFVIEMCCLFQNSNPERTCVVILFTYILFYYIYGYCLSNYQHELPIPCAVLL